MELVYKYFSVVFSRLRARALKTRGATVASKVSVGCGCRFDKPAAMSLGLRVTLEQNVLLKCVADSARLSLGAWSFLGKGVEIDCQGSVDIGEHVLISPGCFITDHNHGILAGKRIDQQDCVVAPVKIEDDVWIGAHSVILPGVQLGRGAVIGAGSVVTRNIPGNSIVAGVPACIIGRRGEAP